MMHMSPSPTSPPKSPQAPTLSPGSPYLLFGWPYDDGPPVVSGGVDADPIPDYETIVGKKWGVFRISVKLPGRDNTHGGYQAACVFHKRNMVTGCKRYFGCRVAGDHERNLQLKKLMWWCNSAKEHDRQYKHVFCPLPEEDCLPDRELLQASKITDMPNTSDILSDVDLDSIIGEPHSGPVLGRGGGRGRGRGRGAPDVVASDPDVVASAGADAASSNSSSSSSSSDSESTNSSSSD